jgi:hypothetical protein
MPAAYGRARKLDAVARVDAFEPMQRQMVLPALDDGVSEQAWSSEPTLDRKLGVCPTNTSVRSPRALSLRTNFGLMMRATTSEAGRRSSTAVMACALLDPVATSSTTASRGLRPPRRTLAAVARFLPALHALRPGIPRRPLHTRLRQKRVSRETAHDVRDATRRTDTYQPCGGKRKNAPL